jgi:hypothetical protein
MMYPIPEYAEVIPIREFADLCKNGCFTNHDGTGYYGTIDEMDRNLIVDCNHVGSHEYPYVIWFNK